MEISYARFAGRSTKIFQEFRPRRRGPGDPSSGRVLGPVRCPGQKVRAGAWRRSVAVGGHKVHRAARSRARRPHGSSPNPLSSLKVHRAAQSRARRPHGSSFTPPLLQGTPRRLKPSPPPSTARVSSPLLPQGPPRRPAFHSSFKLKSHPSLPSRSTAPPRARRWSAPHSATIPAPRGLSPWTGEAKVRPCARDARTSSTASRIPGQAGRRTNPFHPSRATTSSPPSTRPGPPTACAVSPTAGNRIWSSSPSKHRGMPRRNSSQPAPRAASIMLCAEPGGVTACSVRSRCVPSGKTPSRSCSATSPPNWIARIWPIRATPTRWRRRPGRMAPSISTSPWPAGMAAIGITCTSWR